MQCRDDGQRELFDVDTLAGHLLPPGSVGNALDRVLAERAVRRAELIIVTAHHKGGPQPTHVLDPLTDLGDRILLIRGNADRELLHMSRGIDVGLTDDPVSSWGVALSAGF